MNDKNKQTHSPLTSTNPHSYSFTQQCYPHVFTEAQEGVTNTASFNQRGGVWMKPAVPERPVFFIEPEQERIVYNAFF